jgi:hypothetical protein
LNAAAPYLALLALLLVGPDLYHLTKDVLWDFLSQRWAPALVPVVFIAVYVMAYPALFFLLRTGWESVATITGLWTVLKVFT